MRSLFFIVCMLFCLAGPGAAQVRFHVSAGASPESSPRTAGLLVNRQIPAQQFMLRLQESGPKYYGGLTMQVRVASGFFGETGLRYSRQSHVYSALPTYVSDPSVQPARLRQTEDQLWWPVSVGVELGVLEVTTGLTGIFTLSRHSDLEQVAGYSDAGRRFHAGWGGGIRIRIFGVTWGLEYQATLSRLGQGQAINGQSLEVWNLPGRVFATMQYRI